MGVLKVVRSPAKVCWHITFNGQLIETADTKAQAIARKEELSRKVGLL